MKNFFFPARDGVKKVHRKKKTVEERGLLGDDRNGDRDRCVTPGPGAALFFFLLGCSLFVLREVFRNPDAKLESGLRRRIGCLRAQEPSARLLLNSRTAEGRRRRRGISGAVWIPGSAGSRTSAGGRVSTSTFSAAARRLCFSGSRVRVEVFFLSLFLSLSIFLSLPSFSVLSKETKKMCSSAILFFGLCEKFSLKFFFWVGENLTFRLVLSSDLVVSGRV